jgi:hypothetical protein
VPHRRRSNNLAGAIPIGAINSNQTYPRRVRELFGDELASIRPVNGKDALRVVGAVVARHIDEGQIAKVGAALLEDVSRVIGF